MSLEGKVAIVTGSSQGIGAATAKLLAENRAQVVVNYNRSEDKGKAVLEEIQSKGGKAILIKCDVTNTDDVENMIKTTLENFGRIDILVNNASIPFLVKPFTKTGWEELSTKLLNEIKAVYNCVKAVIPKMIEQKSGKIINISSTASYRPPFGFTIYSTAKAALEGMSRCLALELAHYGITVNVVAPDFTLTEYATKRMPKEFHEETIKMTPLGRICLPEDVAGAVLFYAQETSNFVTGTLLPLDGGRDLK